MAEGYGYGKVILFGEHFVVYGMPAIAAGISRKTVATAERGTAPGITVADNRPAAPGYKEEYVQQQKESIERMKPFFGMDFNKNPVKITLAGDLYCASGIGASAASCVAMARAISGLFNLKLTDEKVNAAALEGDKAYAGNPSGIDNTASTYGGLIYYIKGLPLERPKLGKPLSIVMANSGITTQTKTAVERVKAGRDKEPEKYAKIFKEEEAVIAQARAALEKGDSAKAGALMKKNHSLLQQMGVSCDKLDKLVAAAEKAGAIGAKMTGGGMGGYMFALVRPEDQDRVADELMKAGAQHTIKAEIR